MARMMGEKFGCHTQEKAGVKKEIKKETELRAPPPSPTLKKTTVSEKEANMVGQKMCYFGLGARGEKENQSITL